MWIPRTLRGRALAGGVLVIFLLLALWLKIAQPWNGSPGNAPGPQTTAATRVQAGVLVTRTPGDGSPASFPTATPTVENTSGWKLMFDDEFQGSTIDSGKWNVEDYGTDGYKNCCLDYGEQYYTPQALTFTSSGLRITTRKQQMGGLAYTSGALTTENKFSFKYGRVDIRARLPKTDGMWPAFWLIPEQTVRQASYEIDMMEYLGSDPTTMHMINHWGGDTNYSNYQGIDFSQAFHNYTLIWTSSYIACYIDGVKRFETFQGISNQKMYLIINSTIGGSWGGPPDNTTVLPQNLDIQYVRIYQPVG